MTKPARGPRSSHLSSADWTDPSADRTSTLARPLRVADPCFAEGEVVANRFRIVRHLGRGGMGDVYAAEDWELGERVALKTLRRDIADSDAALLRFRRELQLARKVTHVNVCRSFDVFRHHCSGSGHGERDVTLVSMELLEGETLRELTRREGRLPREAALPIVEQIAAGLGAAHAVGIVHRDLKSANVMLVKNADGGMRAVVTDFGLARSDGSDSALSTGQGVLVGTPMYMAPEQVEGREATSASDIYALGVVLYEMMTGTTPFRADSPAVAAAMRLHTQAPSPRRHVPGLDQRWESVILRCLERRPEDRFASAGDVARALRGGSLKLPRRRRQWLIGASLATLLGAAIGAGSRLADWGSSTQLRPATAMRRSVAVLGFRNLSGRVDNAWMSGAFAEMLGTELTAGRELKTLSGEAVAQMKSDLMLAEAESFTAETLARIRRHSDADYVVLGSYLTVPAAGDGSMRLDLRVQDTKSGETVLSATESGGENQILNLVERAGVRLRESLGMTPLSAAESVAVRASQPTSVDAARLYAEGLGKLRAYDSVGARDALRRAVAADPEFPLARVALARALSAMGHDQDARREAEAAFQGSAKLTRAEALSVEAEYRRMTGDWGRAIEVYERLLQRSPDDLEAGLGLYEAHRLANRDASPVIQRLLRLPPPLCEDPRIDLAQMWTLSDARRSLEAAERAVHKAEARGARQLLAFARFRQAAAYAALGEREPARRLYAQAADLAQQVGDPVRLGLALNNEGLLYSEEGRIGDARQRYERFATLARASGSRYLADAQVNLAVALLSLGEIEAGRRMLEEAMRQIQPQSRWESAAFYAVTGEIARARSLVELDPAGTEPWTLAVLRSTRAEISLLQGRLEAAETDLDAAIQFFEGAKRRTQLIGARQNLARVRLAQGRASEAEALAARVVQEAGEQSLRPLEALAAAIQAEAQAALGSHARAAESIERSLAAAGRTDDRYVRLSAAVSALRVRVSRAGAAGPSEALALASQARQLGFVPLELEVRLLHAELLIGGGRGREARQQAASLAREARTLEYGWVAARAATLAEQPPAARR